MSLEVDAVYEDGVLKPASPLPLAEHQRVRGGGTGGNSYRQSSLWDDSVDRRCRGTA